MCRDWEDFRFLWNCIAVCSYLAGVRILCICLMSNHFHVLLIAPPDAIRRFFHLIKIKTGRFLKKKYGKSPIPGLEYKIFPVADRRAFCQETAYILRNPYKARLENPITYPWSSALAYFSGIPRESSRVETMSFREKWSVLHTKASLPPTFRVSDGIILPESFIDTAYVEKMFGGSSLMLFDLLRKWNIEDSVDSMHGDTVTEAYSDEEVLAGIREICQDVFGGISPSGMDQKTLKRLVRKVFSRYGCSRSQFLRILPVDEYLLDGAL